MDMHDSDPPDLEEFAEATGMSTIQVADDLSPVKASEEEEEDEIENCGVFKEQKRGIAQPAIFWDAADLPEENPDDDDDGESPELASVEA